MPVKCLSNQMLEVLRFKRKTILCKIKIVPRKITYFNGQPSPQKTFQWMQTEHWAEFDANLERILTKCSGNPDWDLQEEFEEFKLNSLILVRVKRSALPVETLCRFVDDDINKGDVVLSLDCVIEHSENAEWNVGKLITNANVHSALNSRCGSQEDTEYKPQFVSPQGGIENNISSAYVPYTPSPTKGKNCVLKNDQSSEFDEEPYSPKAVDDLQEKISLSAQSIPEYCPKRIKKVKEAKTEKLGKRENGEAKTEQSQRLPHSKRCDTADKLAETDKNRLCKEESKKKSKEESDEVENEIEHLVSKTSNRNEEHCAQVVTRPRRSSRSPVKNIRYIEEIPLKHKKHKSKIATNQIPLNRSDLFGSDEDEKCGSKKLKNLVAELPTSIANTENSKNRRKRERTDCEEEKRTLNTWLSKQTSTTTTKHSNATGNKGTPKKRKNDPPLIPSNIADEDEPKFNIDVMIQQEKLKLGTKLELNQMLGNVKKPVPPKAVKKLSLDKMTFEEIEETFLLHKPMLDQLFKNCSKKTYVRSYNGIDHYLVMNLLDNSMQLQMMHKLRDSFEENYDGSSLYASHFSNAMMPEWIMGIFMAKYKFSRDEAIAQIKAQEAYRVHLEAQTNTTFNTF